MTLGARIVAVIVGVAGAALALTDAVREIVLASDPAVRWRSSTVLERLTSEPDWATWVAAAVAAALAVALIVLAVRQLAPADGGPSVIQFQNEAGWARVDVHAVERGLRKRLQGTMPGVSVGAVELRKAGEVWRVTVRADVPARDVQALRARMQALAGEDLLRIGGMRLRRLDLVVSRLGAA